MVTEDNATHKRSRKRSSRATTTTINSAPPVTAPETVTESDRSEQLALQHTALQQQHTALQQQLTQLQAVQQRWQQERSAVDSEQQQRTTELAERIEQMKQRLAQRLDDLQAASDQLQSELAPLSQQVTKQQLEQHRQRADLTQLAARNTAHDVQIKLFQQAGDRQRQQLTTLTEQGDQQQRQIDDQQQQLTTLTEQGDQQQRQIDDQQQQFTTLTEQGDQQQRQIGALERSDETLRERLLLQQQRLSRQRWRLAAAFIVVVAVLAAISGYQYQLWQHIAHANLVLNARLSEQQLLLGQSRESEAALQRSVTELQGELAQQRQANGILANQSATLASHSARLAERVATMDETLRNLDGRLSAATPQSQFGIDNRVHGPSWLRQQSADHYVITLAEVSEPEQLFQIAQRLNYYLKQTLAYYERQDRQGVTHYVLIYGPFDDRAEAQRISYRLPPPDLRQRPAVVQIRDIIDRPLDSSYPAANSYAVGSAASS